MFDIGFWELVLVAVVALLVLGPERLPAAATTVGRWAGYARNMARQFRQEMEREARDAGAVDDAKRLLDESRDEIAQVAQVARSDGDEDDERR